MILLNLIIVAVLILVTRFNFLFRLRFSYHLRRLLTQTHLTPTRRSQQDTSSLFSLTELAYHVSGAKIQGIRCSKS